jgi:hypothetical protein
MANPPANPGAGNPPPPPPNGQNTYSAKWSGQVTVSCVTPPVETGPPPNP